MTIWRSWLFVSVGAAFIAAAQPAAGADMLAGAPLAQALRAGGYVIVMRHASAPPLAPDSAKAEPDNDKLERQLDDAGKESARAMGAALRRLSLPIGAVYVSPTYRAGQTARLASLPAPMVTAQLGDGGASMSNAAVAGWGDWLKKAVAAKPRPGTDSVFVTQYPNIAAAFPDEAKGLSDGEALVFRPDGQDARVIARVKIGDWPSLASAR